MSPVVHRDLGDPATPGQAHRPDHVLAGPVLFDGGDGHGQRVVDLLVDDGDGHLRAVGPGEAGHGDGPS